MKKPCIAFCTTCKGRLQHLQQTLPVNMAHNADYENAKFIVLDYNSPDGLEDYIRLTYQAEIASGRLVYYRYREDVPFRMAHAKNMAHRLGILNGADILVNMDADNFTGAGFAEYIAEQFRENDEITLWAKMVKTGERRLPRGISGRIVVSRHAFLNAGGYDEKYETYSPDDKDFNARLRRMGYIAKEIDDRFLMAVLHNDKMRYREYPHAATTTTCEEFEIEHQATVVNYGYIGCGTVWKNFQSEPIQLERLPTRIFGIGMHKTATTSLHTAFKSLGYRSGHWENAHWAKAIWREMNSSGRSPTMERFYALTDLPIPVLYRKLDVAYPGSKFVLTIRNENDWLESVRKHWDRAYNTYRDAWEHDPFTHQIHKAIYGRKGFDPVVFVQRYRRHNAEVMEYFKNRPDDLLVMDMEDGMGWDKLCEFLKVPQPKKEYPKEYVTKVVEERHRRHHHHHHIHTLLAWIIRLIRRVVTGLIWLLNLLLNLLVWFLNWLESKLKKFTIEGKGR